MNSKHLKLVEFLKVLLEFSNSDTFVNNHDGVEFANANANNANNKKLYFVSNLCKQDDDAEFVSFVTLFQDLLNNEADFIFEYQSLNDLAYQGIAFFEIVKKLEIVCNEDLDLGCEDCFLCFSDYNKDRISKINRMLQNSCRELLQVLFLEFQKYLQNNFAKTQP